jgi:thiopeptide-type bacteriocin biosynthesis protein
MNRDWISLYIYYHEEPTPLLVRCLKPLVASLKEQKQISASFFVRYWEGGPHVRFRVLPMPSTPASQLRDHLQERIRAYLHLNPSRASIDPERYATATAYFSSFERGQVQQFALQPNNTVLEVAYVPEYDAYGGERSMRVAEQQFSDSSEVALALLEQEVTSEQRIGRALLMMLGGLRRFSADPRELSSWFAVYHRNWMPALQPDPETFARVFQTRFQRQRERLVRLVDDVLSPTASADRWLEVWQASLDRLHAHLASQEPITSRDDQLLIGLNCLHMHNNRMGISLPEEAYLTYLVHHALEAWLHASSTRTAVREPGSVCITEGRDVAPVLSAQWPQSESHTPHHESCRALSPETSVLLKTE